MSIKKKATHSELAKNAFLVLQNPIVVDALDNKEKEIDSKESTINQLIETVKQQGAEFAKRFDESEAKAEADRAKAEADRAESAKRFEESEAKAAADRAKADADRAADRAENAKCFAELNSKIDNLTGIAKEIQHDVKYCRIFLSHEFPNQEIEEHDLLELEVNLNDMDQEYKLLSMNPRIGQMELVRKISIMTPIIQLYKKQDPIFKNNLAPDQILEYAIKCFVHHGCPKRNTPKYNEYLAYFFSKYPGMKQDKILGLLTQGSKKSKEMFLRMVRSEQYSKNLVFPECAPKTQKLAQFCAYLFAKYGIRQASSFDTSETFFVGGLSPLKKAEKSYPALP